MLVMKYNPNQKMQQDEVFLFVLEDLLCRNHNKEQLNESIKIIVKMLLDIYFQSILKVIVIPI